MESPSNTSHSLTQSPFEIPHEDVNALCASEGFLVLRRYLASTAATTFCAHHANCSQPAQETWLLHRDLLHALVMPVVELFKRASALAEAALCTPKPEDLELAFSGEARGAFLWLQCFITEEEEWCRTGGCPGCVTTATLSTESHIRITIAASLLSTSSISSPGSSPLTSNLSSATSSPTEPTPPAEHDVPAPAAGLTLPPLPHILPALREALSNDPFWGPEYWSYLFARATQLSAGIQLLIAECVNLESLVSSPPTPKSKAPTHRQGVIHGLLDTVSEEEDAEGKGAKLRKSKMAKRQLRMKREEIDLMRRCALQCWAAAAVPSKLRKEILGRGERRLRSLTCP
ncbi:hypothetical protein K469DRAFT_707005 [Zopfia rhizophila CBS 207.26]|uniref:Uncharacterized protein n=1 Tax=Zopfia rhizophila CBS 207.26 TaxID=1314779 RepID=A0A6A6E3F2_9PEZI|nr:hypothetical protein K469DRAFT_707005 [Zopfia rhizophila CBS 207.26]